MSRDKPPLYSLRLWLAKRRRHLNQWILLKLSRCLERLTKRQLSLLSQRRDLSQSRGSDRKRLLLLNLLFPLSLSSEQDEEMLEDLQLLCRRMSTRLGSRS